jgi:6-phosphofructokinase 1
MATILRVSDAPYRAEYGTTPVSAVANQVKTVPAAYINEAGNGITEEGLAYLLPLIQGELTPVFRDGLPVHIIL